MKIEPFEISCSPWAMHCPTQHRTGCAWTRIQGCYSAPPISPGWIPTIRPEPPDGDIPLKSKPSGMPPFGSYPVSNPKDPGTRWRTEYKTPSKNSFFFRIPDTYPIVFTQDQIPEQERPHRTMRLGPTNCSRSPWKR